MSRDPYTIVGQGDATKKPMLKALRDVRQRLSDGSNVGVVLAARRQNDGSQDIFINGLTAQEIAAVACALLHQTVLRFDQYVQQPGVDHQAAALIQGALAQAENLITAALGLPSARGDA